MCVVGTWCVHMVFGLVILDPLYPLHLLGLRRNVIDLSRKLYDNFINSTILNCITRTMTQGKRKLSKISN